MTYRTQILGIYIHAYSGVYGPECERQIQYTIILAEHAMFIHLETNMRTLASAWFALCL